MRCLIAEDENLARETLKFFLAEYAEVETATDGREAVELFGSALAAKKPFDLVLLDILMPEMDGQQALRQMRQLEHDQGIDAQGKAVIVMTTALTTPEAMEEALWDGDCNDFVVKPVSRADIRGVLTKYRLI
ncbi:response regulator [Geomonas sp. Red32]|uniref:response regulator n=1 Tax=Geomonas sp. Red32 TaxID=2912856 RepID=UPI00202CACAB|nr:response regulator [Geomonas sp. Red32]MCM0080347.1 response regulator [Geomonas sp. Red32]